MARFSRARAWAGRRGFSSYRAIGGRRMYGFRGSYKSGRQILGMSVPGIVGIAAGYFAPRVHPLQDVAITGVAVLPRGLVRTGVVGGFAKGYVLGMVIKTVLPNLGGMLGGQNGGSDVI